MKPEEILRIVDAIHRDKGIDKEIVFQAIEAALARPALATARTAVHVVDVETGEVIVSSRADELMCWPVITVRWT